MFQNVTFRQRVEKDLKYLAPFEVNVKKLPSFFEAIDREWRDYVGQEESTSGPHLQTNSGNSGQNNPYRNNNGYGNSARQPVQKDTRQSRSLGKSK